MLLNSATVRSECPSMNHDWKTHSMIALLVWVLVPTLHSGPSPQNPGQYQNAAQAALQSPLLYEEPLSEDITSLRVTEVLNNPLYKGDAIFVDLVGGWVPDCVALGQPCRCVPGDKNVCGQYLANPPKFPRPLKNLAIQVWLLRANGTALAQKSKRIGGGICNAGSCDDRANFVFEHVVPNELAGVVVRVDGKLLVCEIKSK
jgi:hypothetical protein